MANKLKTMDLHQLEMERFEIRERIILANGVAKRDLVKYLSRLNAEIGKRRKL